MTNNPTGKQNAFAAHGLPELVLVEFSKTKLPVTYANAFLEPVEGKNLMTESANALSEYVKSISAAYAPADTKRLVMKVASAKDAEFDATICPSADELVKQVKAVLEAEG